ncbi:AAA family ATPase [Candidatus Odyssella acanthamoebae]|uniref:AAA family ATPase n=1 Tax=Candidatus Odyssella acanthamoebae TaxID=91604 RepID=UPI0005707AFA|nr:AAA family ATPase [Candidatus Paracaedibacter acanthamoebae]
MKNTIIYLIGFAGTGKFTIAQEIAKLTNSKVVDNHLINNPILSVIDAEQDTTLSDRAWQKIEEIRQIVLDTIETIAAPNASFIFTNELIEGRVADKQIFSKIAELAKRRQSTFLPVRLECSEEELCRRVLFENRKERLKDTNPKNAQEKYKNLTVLKPTACTSLTLDVTHLSAEQTARIILDHLNFSNKQPL